LTESEGEALRSLSVDASQSESPALDRRETKKVWPLWLTVASNMARVCPSPRVRTT